VLKITDCFVVPPRNDTSIWRFGFMVIGQKSPEKRVETDTNHSLTGHKNKASNSLGDFVIGDYVIGDYVISDYVIKIT
jgi:hypothetical protein